MLFLHHSQTLGKRRELKRRQQQRQHTKKERNHSHVACVNSLEDGTPHNQESAENWELSIHLQRTTKNQMQTAKWQIVSLTCLLWPFSAFWAEVVVPASSWRARRSRRRCQFGQRWSQPDKTSLLCLHCNHRAQLLDEKTYLKNLTLKGVKNIACLLCNIIPTISDSSYVWYVWISKQW